MTDWREVVRGYSWLVWQTAYRLLGNPEDAADCFQEAFLAALNVSRRERVANWAGLLRQIATRKALDALRERSRRGRISGEPPDWTTVQSSNPTPVQEAEAAELSARLRAALSELPYQQAEVFCLRYMSDVSYRQIGRLLGLEQSAVGVILHRARQRLREVLSPENVTPDVEVPQ